MTHRYLVALGSNVMHQRHGAPNRVIAAAIAALEAEGAIVESCSPTIATAPVGPSRRRFANAAAVLRSPLDPPAMLAQLQMIEASFGRRRRGRRWAARVLDLDIVLWNGGIWACDGLVIPHIDFRNRDFVLRPSAAIASDWRDPVSGQTVRQLHLRLTRPRPVLR
ncbi:MAG: 2-amino-4-hydroxy-6-hydroxymethyldihydropteridine diphosphokinase [Sphingomonadaceae bacterium]|nr:2-amino-4-hydroxy-6-hydroxymethyldihydropteridine diphosphokinase [Sphingomonadaceae bacterium]